jgi:hypothetical protein
VAYLILATEKDADDRSLLAWEAVLGRKKHPEDITEYLWGRVVGKDGRTALSITEKEELLTVSETAAKVTTLDGNWTK